MSRGDARPSSLRIGLISNPGGGSNKKRLDQVSRIVADCPGLLHRVTESIDDIEPVLSEFAGREIDVLAINGGDGTVSAVLTRLVRSGAFSVYPAIALLPGGTTNMNARDIGARVRLASAATALCNLQAGYDTVTRPLLKVQQGADGEFVCGMFFGAGIIINGIEYCHQQIHARGVGSEVGPGIALARTIWGMLRRDSRFSRPVPVLVELDGRVLNLTRPAQLIMVTALERLFLGMRPWWGVEQGPLHATLVEQPATHFVRRLPGLLRGRAGPGVTPAAGYHSHNTNHLSLTMDGAYTVDGEIYHADSRARALQLGNAGHFRYIRL